MDTEMIIQQYEQSEGMLLSKLSRCFLQQLTKHAPLINDKTYYFYFEKYDFELHIFDDNDFRFTVYNTEVRTRILYFYYYGNERYFNECDSVVYIKNDDRYESFHIVSLSCFSDLPILMRDLYRAKNKPLNISEEMITNYLQQECIPKSNGNIKLSTITLDDDTKCLVESIKKELDREHQYYSNIDKTEHTHKINRLKEKELPELIASFSELSNEEKKKQKEFFHNQLENVLYFLRNENDEDRKREFERKINLFQKRYDISIVK